MFIVIEGVDGAGKRTQTELLSKKLKEGGSAVKSVSFPSYGHWSATFVEKFLNGEFGRTHTVDPYLASTFYTADRFGQKYNLEKDIAVYDYLISDRYSMSSFIHRGSIFLQEGQEDQMRDFFSWLYDLEFNRAKLPLPDKIFFLSMSLDNIESNLRKKELERIGQKTYTKGLDDAEKDLEHQKFSLMVGKEILPGYFDNYIIIDCEDKNGRLLTPQAIHQKILAHVI